MILILNFLGVASGTTSDHEHRAHAPWPATISAPDRASSEPRLTATEPRRPRGQRYGAGPRSTPWIALFSAAVLSACASSGPPFFVAPDFAVRAPSYVGVLPIEFTEDIAATRGAVEAISSLQRMLARRLRERGFRASEGDSFEVEKTVAILEGRDSGPVMGIDAALRTSASMTPVDLPTSRRMTYRFAFELWDLQKRDVIWQAECVKNERLADTAANPAAIARDEAEVDRPTEFDQGPSVVNWTRYRRQFTEALETCFDSLPQRGTPPDPRASKTD